MTTRLNETIREAIIEAIREKTYRPQKKKLIERKEQLGQKVYENQYGQFKEQMAALPDGWLEQSDHISCYFNGEHAYLPLGGSYRFPRKCKRQGFAASHKFCKEWQALTAADDKLAADSSLAIRNTRAALKSYRTVEQLLKAWPEVKAFLPSNLDNPPVKECTALTIPLSTLNSMLGLSKP